MKLDFINNWKQLDFGITAAAIGAGAALAGSGGQIAATSKLNRKTRHWNEKMYGIQRADALKDWNAQNQYNSPEEQMKRLKAAGLNPALMYGGGPQPGGITQPTRGANPGSWNPETPNVKGMGIEVMQAMMIKAQIDNLNADTKDKLANIPNKEATTPNILADTENKKLAAIIADYTGKELKDVYEEVNKPNRDMQARALTDNYSAQSAIGQNLNEMFITGQLRDKSNAEVEQIILSNSKTSAETRNIIKAFDALEQNIKGQKLENAFKELDLKLQKETGLGRDSPGWSKLFGRLLQLLMQ